MASSKEYWKKRERKNIKNQIKDDNKLARKIRRNQLDVMEDIQEQIDAFYGRFATKEGFTMEQARKRATKLDMNKYEKKAKKYVKEKNFSPKANEEMRVYNMTMKTQRLELLKANINLELVAMTDEELSMMLEGLTKQARQEYQRQAGILGESLNYNEKNIKSIVNSSFQNADWSTRLWANQYALRSELNNLLTRGVVQGKNPRELARELRKKFDASVYNSERLMVTESSRVQTDVFVDSMEQAEIKQYIWVAEPSACDECAELDGKVFDLKDMEIGSTGVPKHPFCKCSLAGYVERKD